MNPKLRWTKEMIDYIKEINPLDPISTFPIRINIQDNFFSFTQKDHWAFDGIDMEEESNYFGQTRYDDMDYYHEDGTINIEASMIKETYELLAQVYVKIEFFDQKLIEDEKSKIFNHKSLNIDIQYDSEFMENIKYEQFCTSENSVPIKRICCIALQRIFANPGGIRRFRRSKRT